MINLGKLRDLVTRRINAERVDYWSMIERAVKGNGKVDEIALLDAAAAVGRGVADIERDLELFKRRHELQSLAAPSQHSADFETSNAELRGIAEARRKANEEFDRREREARARLRRAASQLEDARTAAAELQQVEREIRVRREGAAVVVAEDAARRRHKQATSNLQDLQRQFVAAQSHARYAEARLSEAATAVRNGKSVPIDMAVTRQAETARDAVRLLRLRVNAARAALGMEPLAADVEHVELAAVAAG